MPPKNSSSNNSNSVTKQAKQKPSNRLKQKQKPTQIRATTSAASIELVTDETNTANATASPSFLGANVPTGTMDGSATLASMLADRDDENTPTISSRSIPSNIDIPLSPRRGSTFSDPVSAPPLGRFSSFHTLMQSSNLLHNYSRILFVIMLSFFLYVSFLMLYPQVTTLLWTGFLAIPLLKLKIWVISIYEQDWTIHSISYQLLRFSTHLLLGPLIIPLSFAFDIVWNTIVILGSKEPRPFQWKALKEFCILFGSRQKLDDRYFEVLLLFCHTRLAWMLWKRYSFHFTTGLLRGILNWFAFLILVWLVSLLINIFPAIKLPNAINDARDSIYNRIGIDVFFLYRNTLSKKETLRSIFRNIVLGIFYLTFLSACIACIAFFIVFIYWEAIIFFDNMLTNLSNPLESNILNRKILENFNITAATVDHRFNSTMKLAMDHFYPGSSEIWFDEIVNLVTKITDPKNENGVPGENGTSLFDKFSYCGYNSWADADYGCFINVLWENLDLNQNMNGDSAPLIQLSRYLIHFFGHILSLVFVFIMTFSDGLVNFFLFIFSLQELISSKTDILEVWKNILSYGTPQRAFDESKMGIFHKELSKKIYFISAAAIKKSAFHMLFSWVTFSFFDVHFVYLCILFSGIITFIPILPTVTGCVPIVLQLLFSTKENYFTYGIILAFSHALVYIFLDSGFYSVPGIIGWITFTSVGLGMYTFGVNGIIIGPLTLAVVKTFYDVFMVRKQPEAAAAAARSSDNISWRSLPSRSATPS